MLVPKEKEGKIIPAGVKIISPKFVFSLSQVAGSLNISCGGNLNIARNNS